MELCRRCSSRSVSYTHLDVYKRQGKRGVYVCDGGGDSDGVKNYASAEQIIIFRAGEVSIRHFIGMPLILV